MRKLFLLAALFVATALHAQEYPAKPVSMIAPFPPGGVAEIVGRPLGAAMEKTLKQPVLLANRAGITGIHAPSRGGGPAGAALRGGRGRALAGGTGPGAGQIKAGKMRAVGGLGDKRLEGMAGLPTFKERGCKDVEFYI